jgi:hypothetical protein
MGEHPGDAPRVYTADEAAAILRCKPSWLKEQARQWMIPVTFIASSYRWTGAQLDEILALGERRPRTRAAPARPVTPAPRKAPRSPEPPAGAPEVPLLQARPPRRRPRPSRPGSLARDSKVPWLPVSG